MSGGSLLWVRMCAGVGVMCVHWWRGVGCGFLRGDAPQHVGPLPASLGRPPPRHRHPTHRPHPSRPLPPPHFLKTALCRVSALDSGKPMVDAAFGEVLVTCEKIWWLLREGERHLRPERRSGSTMVRA